MADAPLSLIEALPGSRRCAGGADKGYTYVQKGLSYLAPPSRPQAMKGSPEGQVPLALSA